MARTQGPPNDDPFYRRGRADRNSYAEGAVSPQHAGGGRAGDFGLPPKQANYRPAGDPGLWLDAGLTEADDPEEQQQFRRANRRVPVKRGALPRRLASRMRTAVLLALAIAVLGTAAYQVRDFALHSGRFRLRTEKDIELAGEAPNSSAAVMEKMREVLGRNLFLISMDERKRALERIPWVESATVMRLWPNRLRVQVKERTPVAFVAIGGRIGLIDAQGVVMEMSLPRHANSGRAGDPPPAMRQPENDSFSVIRGMTESDPLSTRAARMKTFARLVRELDGDEGATGQRAGGDSGSISSSVSNNPGKVQYSRNLEEVDLSDPEDVKITVKGPSGPILLHLGNENFLPRFMLYLSNVQKWEHDRGRLESVDLRYGRQVILNPEMIAEPPVTAPSNVAGASLAAMKLLRHPKPPAMVGSKVLKDKAANDKVAKAKILKERTAKFRAGKTDAAHSRPQRAVAAKPRHGKGKKPT